MTCLPLIPTRCIARTVAIFCFLAIASQTGSAQTASSLSIDHDGLTLRHPDLGEPALLADRRAMVDRHRDG
ncbi:hypothetical protein Enr13x_16830 [Stieleria neptunia]|uniref:Uncharacterized protein n=1 Tax=Stieleria neptunia TaxID=2527979 RepID=A0A518HLZ1_9BACT|nr:hypothetical protein [Stieleria neptunia]QDV41840.1 hypothetical protein Enr13x_16830 [Stieleria neptunia]